MRCFTGVVLAPPRGRGSLGSDRETPGSDPAILSSQGESNPRIHLGRVTPEPFGHDCVVGCRRHPGDLRSRQPPTSGRRRLPLNSGASPISSTREPGLPEGTGSRLAAWMGLREVATCERLAGFEPAASSLARKRSARLNHSRNLGCLGTHSDQQARSGRTRTSGRSPCRILAWRALATRVATLPRPATALLRRLRWTPESDSHRRVRALQARA